MKRVIIFFLSLFSSTLNAEESETVSYVACGNSPKAIELARLLIESKSQKRKNLNCNASLAETAGLKAQMMADADHISHNLNNITPNELLRQSGVVLPSAYDYLGNQVESISGGAKRPIEAFAQFMKSSAHKEHLMGEGALGLQQDQIGVGYFQDKKKLHEDYWVVYITAFRKKDDKNVRIPTIKHKYYFDNTDLKGKKKTKAN